MLLTYLVLIILYYKPVSYNSNFKVCEPFSAYHRAWLICNQKIHDATDMQPIANMQPIKNL